MSDPARGSLAVAPIVWLMLLLAAMVWPAAAHAESRSGALPTAGACGAIYNTGHYGPYDYRTQRESLVVVDKYHFAPFVESLSHGQSTSIAGDLNYVLKAAPNHHRALVAVSHLGEKLKTDRPADLDYSIDCFYVRAVVFAPDDLIVRAFYARYLDKHSRKDEAKKQLATAVQLAKDDAFSHYNIGLVYFEMGDYDAALAQAWKAQTLGFERVELIKMLKDANKWREPPVERSAPASASASAASAAPAASSP